MPRPKKFLAAIALIASFAAFRTLACPYCTVESSTLSEDMAASDAVVLAKLTPVEGERIIDPDSGKAKFTIDKVLVGKDKMKDVKEIEVVFFGEPIEGRTYFIRGIGVDELDWNIPIPMSDTAVKYVQEIQSLPEKGPERARYFYDYLQHEEPLLAQDAYDEFARTSYPDILDIADKIDHEQLWTWIEDPSVSPNRRSLFFVMLGVVGSEEDEARLKRMMMADGRVLRASAEASAALSMGLGGAITLPILPEMVAMEQRQKQLGFNAMVGCYLKLTGSEGLDVLDAEFLRDDQEDPTKVYGVLLALRFLAEETEDVPMNRLKQSMRLVLEKPDFAEQAIRDLARWEDWTVLDRLVAMFDKADPKTYVKEPIVAYLDQASQQEGEIGEQAAAAVAKIEATDPETVKRARSLMSFGFLGFARPGSRDPGTAPALNDPNDPGDVETRAIEDEAETPETPESTDEESAEDITESAAEEVDTASESTEKPASEQPAISPTTEAPAMVMDPPLVPPSQSLVLGVPLIAACVFVGVVWLVLRGGPQLSLIPHSHLTTMSTTTLQPPATPSHEESNTLEYRALYSGALVAALLGVVSLFMLAVTDFLEVAVLVAVIPALGIIMSLFALRKINNNSDIYTGKPLALFGLIMSAVMLVGGVGRAGYIHATEVPDGYARISFLSLKPNEKDKVAGRPVPKEAMELMTEGQPIFIKGYIRPDSVQSRLGVNEFLLVRDSNQCCFGDLQSVQYFDQIAVKLEPPLTTDFTRDVFRVGGRLMCNPQNLGRGPEYPVYFIVADYVE